jgi:hypothetical protein
MAANTTPIFPLKPYVAIATITGTTTDKSGATTTNLKTLYTATTDGTKVSQIGFKATGNSTQGSFLIFIIPYDEILYSTITSSATVASARGVNSYSDLVLKSGQKIIVGATVVTTNIAAWAQTGDYS